VTDPATKLPTTRNLFAHPQAADAATGLPADAGIVELQRRGVLFIMCNNALTFWVGRLASAGGGAPKDIRADLLTHLLPGVVIVPAMVVAINKAQARGLTYFKAA
jgi:intracellular sulfur oxidation DsrE/DsrF family protein